MVKRMCEYGSVNEMFTQKNEKEERKTIYSKEAKAHFLEQNRSDHLEILQGYGSQTERQHPFYRTSSKEYGWYAPGNHTVPSVYFPIQQKFSSQLAAAGMYRNYSLNTAKDPSP